MRIRLTGFRIIYIYWCLLATAAELGAFIDFFCATNGCKKAWLNSSLMEGRFVGSLLRQPAKTLERSGGNGSPSISGNVIYSNKALTESPGRNY
jgi:hypothetical protein